MNIANCRLMGLALRPQLPPLDVNSVITINYTHLECSQTACSHVMTETACMSASPPTSERNLIHWFAASGFDERKMPTVCSTELNSTEYTTERSVDGSQEAP